MSGDNFEIVPPKPSSLIQSMRAIGYDLPTAIADIIDNSISAQARNVWMNFFWDGANSHIAITDDGTGMSEAMLVEAMRLGSINPQELRHRRDLGRFGLGLKTASFSQCKKLTVLTNWNGYFFARCWDLDFVSACGDWNLLKDISATAAKYEEDLMSLNSGTTVVLETMDRITQDMKTENELDHEVFLHEIDKVRKHCSMVFHRFLERPNGVKVYINTREVKSWDPYLTKEKTTQNLSDEALQIFGDRLNVRPFVLPHVSKISKEAYNDGGGIRGWNAQQGFYVYRNSRLIAAGDWLGLGFQNEEHTKLARILLDIPNTMDEKWGLDVKKSKAFPPKEIRKDLKRIAELTRNRAIEIYRHRGKITAREHSVDTTFMWERQIKDGKIHYVINRNNPFIKEMIEIPEVRIKLNYLLKLLEETIPVPAILIDSKDHPLDTRLPFDGDAVNELKEIATSMAEILYKQCQSPEMVRNAIKCIEPFNQHTVIVDELVFGDNA